MYRNNNGVLQDACGGYVAYGLAKGSADLIGSITLRAGDMPIAVAIGIEVKVPGESPEPHQRAWLDHSRTIGWIVGVATSPDEAVAIVKEGALAVLAKMGAPCTVMF
jgi:hypothetical protein